MNEEEQAKDPNISYFVNEYFRKNYIAGKLKPDGTRKPPRFALELWNVHQSSIEGKLSLIFLIM